jgi:LPS sulfotransferase NodH
MMLRRSDRSKKSLMIATTQRCGGTWLASLMEATGSLGRPEEWLLPGTVLAWGMRHLIPTLKLRSIPACALYRTGMRNDRELYAVYRDAVSPRAIQRYLDRVSRVEATANLVFSAHLQWDQFKVLNEQWKGSILDLADETFWLFLWREDQLEQAISWTRARANSRWESSQQALNEAHYDGPELRRRYLMVIERNQQWVDFFARQGITPFELTYEQVQANPEHAIDEILTWIGETRSTSDLEQQRNLQVQRSAETEEWTVRFAEENPELMAQRFRPRGDIQSH